MRQQQRIFLFWPFPAAALVLGLITACVDNEPVSPEGRVGPPSMAARDAPFLRDRYIVVLKDGVLDPDAFAAIARSHGGSVRHVYRYGLKGFAATLPTAALDGLLHNPNVAYVEPEMIVGHASHVSQTGAPWGLDRLDQRSLPLDQTYNYVATGVGVRAYVLDGPIDTANTEFSGRASLGANVAVSNPGPCVWNPATAVAGTIGSSTYGVAKSVSLIGVQVWTGGCDIPTTGELVAGIDWVIGHHVKPAVMNISLVVWRQVSTNPPVWEETSSQAVDDKVRSAVTSGITTVVSAGNGNQSACNVSPARTAEAITVAATYPNDTRWAGTNIFGSPFGSNYGSCVDIFAPGSNIESVGAPPPCNTVPCPTFSGTSAAAPHVTGVVALYLQSHATATPSQVWTALSTHATVNKLSNIGTGSPNRLAHSVFMDVAISGPASLNGCATYVASPSGGLHGYTYQWSVTWLRTGSTYNLGTGSSQYICTSPSTGSFILRVVVKSLGSDAQASKGVFGGF